jgi:hypothetical protein
METLEEMTLLHTQEAWGSSPYAPTIQINSLTLWLFGAFGASLEHFRY